METLCYNATTMEEQTNPKKSFWKKWWVWVIGVFILFGLIGSLSGSSSPDQSNTPPTQAVATQTPKPTEALQYTFDIPTLVGKNIDQIKTELQPYLTKSVEPNETQIKAGVKDWDASFKKDGKEVLINYSIATKRVNDFFISTDDKSGKTKDKKHLLELGNLMENDSRYRVEFVKVIIDPSAFTGVKVIPK